MLYRLNKKQGFTLIELLVVVAIISLLSSIVIAGMRESRQKAEYAAFATDLMQLRNAFQNATIDDNSGRICGSVSGEINTVMASCSEEYYPTNEYEYPDFVSDVTVYGEALDSAGGLQSCGGVTTLNDTTGFVIRVTTTGTNLEEEIDLKKMYDAVGGNEIANQYCLEQQ
jgi:prepilin-type N-terminal cleavage/methylation domain-containing protein